MISLRTESTEKRYQDYLKIYDGACIYCTKKSLVREFNYWVVVKNDFPYDEVAEEHWMIATKAHKTNESEFSQEEIEEFKIIREWVWDQGFDMMILNAPRKRSIPLHYHNHILKLQK